MSRTKKSRKDRSQYEGYIDFTCSKCSRDVTLKQKSLRRGCYKLGICTGCFDRLHGKCSSCGHSAARNPVKDGEGGFKCAENLTCRKRAPPRKHGALPGKAAASSTTSPQGISPTTFQTPTDVQHQETQQPTPEASQEFGELPPPFKILSEEDFAQRCGADLVGLWAREVPRRVVSRVSGCPPEHRLLKRDVDKLESKNTKLRAENKAISSEKVSLQQQIQSLQQQVQQLQQGQGSGNHSGTEPGAAQQIIQPSQEHDKTERSDDTHMQWQVDTIGQENQQSDQEQGDAESACQGPETEQPTFYEEVEALQAINERLTREASRLYTANQSLDEVNRQLLDRIDVLEKAL